MQALLCQFEGRALKDLYFSTSLYKHLKTADTQAKKMTIPCGFLLSFLLFHVQDWKSGVFGYNFKRVFTEIIQKKYGYEVFWRRTVLMLL